MDRAAERQRKSLLKLRSNLAQSIQNIEIDCSPLELALLKRCHAKINELCTSDSTVSKEALEHTATSLTILSHETKNPAVDQAAMGIHILTRAA